jgi:Tol biopolymer transport system component
MNSVCHRAKVSAIWLILTAPLLLSSANAQISDSLRRHEESDIAKLAELTRIDHSTIFFHGLTKSGYVRDGTIQSVVLKRVDVSALLPCAGEAVSRDGARIAYVTAGDDASVCQIVVRDLRSGETKRLAGTDVSRGLLSWSWDDTEIAYEGGRKLNLAGQRYEGPGAVVAVSVADGRSRTLARLPLQFSGVKLSGNIGNLLSIAWLHQRSAFIACVNVCVPTREAGTCQEQRQTFLLSWDDSRLLAVGGGVAVTPAGDHIAVVTKDSVVVIDADGSKQRRITGIPAAAFYFPFIKETTFWSNVVWSPSGDRLWFNTIINEEFNSNLYLVDLKTGRRRRALKNTSLTITAWR